MSHLRFSTVLVIVALLGIPARAGRAEEVAHTYDGRNRLIRTEYGDGTGIEYVYDAAGNRIGQKALVPVPSLTADLAIRMKVRRRAVAGRKIAYVVRVRNKSKVAVPGVVVSARLPGGVTLIKKPGYCTPDGGGLSCALGTLKRRASKRLKIVVTTAQAGAVSHTASVKGDAVDPNPGDNTVVKQTLVKEARRRVPRG